MTDLSRSQIEEAVEAAGRWNLTDSPVLKRLTDTARAVLSAPTVRWCGTHADQVLDHLMGVDQPVVCRWGMKVDGSKDCRLVGTVALVPMEDGEQ